MGFWSSVGSFCSSVVSSVSSGLSAAASWAGDKLSNVINTGLRMGSGFMNGLSNVASGLGRAFGFFKENDPPVEEIGDRAIQMHEQGIFPDKFDDFQAYMEEIRSFDIDPEKSKDSTPDQKIFKGLEVAGRGLEDKFNAPTGSMANVWVLAGANPDYFTSERLQSLLNAGVDIPSVVDYFEGKMGGAESLDIEDELVDIDQKSNPGKEESTSRQELYAAVETAKNILN